MISLKAHHINDVEKIFTLQIIIIYARSKKRVKTRNILAKNIYHSKTIIFEES